MRVAYIWVDSARNTNHQRAPRGWRYFYAVAYKQLCGCYGWKYVSSVRQPRKGSGINGYKISYLVKFTTLAAALRRLHVSPS